MSDFYCEEVFSGKTDVDIIEETENILAFHHTRPIYTFHAVVVPKKHFLNLLDVDKSILHEIIDVICEVINKNNLADGNYKVITNGGSFQDSKHLHFHILSGEIISR